MEVISEAPLRRFVDESGNYQAAHWPEHQKKCLAVQAFIKKRKAREAAELEANGMDTER